jgi:hypothetical protein
VNTLYAGQPTYIDHAVINNGSATASGTFYIHIYLDGTRIGSWYNSNLSAGWYGYYKDYSYTVSTSGWHTLKLVADVYGNISESDEGDNTWEKAFYWYPNPNAKPNLRPYTPSGWDYPIVPSSVKGTTGVNTLYAGQPTYIDWAVINDDLATASGRFYIHLYLDATRIGSWYTSDLRRGWYVYVRDKPYTVSTQGWHTLKLVADAYGNISESDEGDNTWEKAFYWQPNPDAKPNLEPYTPSGWDYPIVPSSVRGTTSVNTLYAGQPTYIDWAVANVGNATASSKFYTYIYLDGKRIAYWYTTSLRNGYYTYIRDWAFTVDSPGDHTLKIVVDATGNIDESNESDNTWERTFSWEWEERALNIRKVRQPDGSLWCWAATIESILSCTNCSFPSTSAPQCESVNCLFEQTTCCADWSSSECNRGARDEEQISWAYSNCWSFDSTHMTSSLPFSTLKDEIHTHKRPVNAVWRWSLLGEIVGAHAVPVYGYKVDKTEWVYYMDPGEGTEGERHLVKYEDFVRDGTILIRTWSGTIYEINEK